MNQFMALLNEWGATIGIVAVTSIITVMGAALISKNSHGSRRRLVTIQLIFDKHWDRDYLEAKATFNRLKNSDGNLRSFASTDKMDTQEARHIRAVLNDYELMSLGVMSGLLDENLYRRWFRSSFLADHNAAKGYIDAVRGNRNIDALYKEFDALAAKWKPRDNDR